MSINSHAPNSLVFATLTLFDEFKVASKQFASKFYMSKKECQYEINFEIRSVKISFFLIISVLVLLKMFCFKRASANINCNFFKVTSRSFGPGRFSEKRSRDLSVPVLE
jgi:hypothetical protein